MLEACDSQAFCRRAPPQPVEEVLPSQVLDSPPATTLQTRFKLITVLRFKTLFGANPAQQRSASVCINEYSIKVCVVFGSTWKRSSATTWTMPPDCSASGRLVWRCFVTEATLSIRHTSSLARSAVPLQLESTTDERRASHLHLFCRWIWTSLEIPSFPSSARNPNETT